MSRDDKVTVAMIAGLVLAELLMWAVLPHVR